MSILRNCVILFLSAFHTTGRCEIIPQWIEPSAKVLPANFLKFYLHFSEPMERGDVFRYLRLLKVNEDGSEEAVVEPFREVELWGPDFRTLTLWLHPGRQKPGVNLNVEMGPILEEGGRYRLEVSSEWKTQKGRKLDGPLLKIFRVGPVDNEQPDPGCWLISISPDKRLVIETDGDLDPASLRKRLRVVDSVSKKNVHFDAQIFGNRVILASWLEPAFEELWRSSWRPGTYSIKIDPRLEDLAGNSIARPFNLDLERLPDFVEKTDLITIPFRITESHKVEITLP